MKIIIFITNWFRIRDSASKQFIGRVMGKWTWDLMRTERCVLRIA